MSGSIPYGAAAIGQAAAIVRRGGIVAVGTETVYGLATDARSDDGVARIFAAKGRPAHNPLIVHVADRDAAARLARFDARADALAAAHWPGPLTLVLPRRDDAPLAAAVTAGLATVAIRVSAHPAMRALIAASGCPIAAPSANASGRLSTTRAAHVAASLGSRVDLIIDSGPSAVGIESTILEVLPGLPVRCLRAGPILTDVPMDDRGGVRAPGALAAHYAPGKPLRLEATDRRADEWLIGFGAVAGDATLSATGNLDEAAALLFARLHEADRAPSARIAVAPVPATGVGRAINDRLARAAIGANA